MPVYDPLEAYSMSLADLHPSSSSHAVPFQAPASNHHDGSGEGVQVTHGQFLPMQVSSNNRHTGLF